MKSDFFRKILMLLMVLVASNFIWSQEKFQYLKCQGELPEDFLNLSFDNYREDFKSNKEKELDRNFFESTRFFIDELLLSGDILFNDPVTNYVNKVANELLKDDRKLREELRFYTLKSQVPNAFSTDQGIIFVSIGLLARLNNEAELAFVLAHEISHFKNHHVREGYITRKEIDSGHGRYKLKNYQDKIARLSAYQHNLEFDADFGGLEFLKNSSYDLKAAISCLEVLSKIQYPAVNMSISNEFLNIGDMIVPEKYFPDSIPQIEIDLETDDSNVSHPNLNKRIEKLKAETIHEKTESKYFVHSKDEFLRIKQLSLFELVNIHLLNREYIQALFLVEVLKQEYKDNYFLDLSFLKALYGITKYKIEDKYDLIHPKFKTMKGSIFKIFSLIDDLKTPQLICITYRHAFNFVDNKYKGDSTFEKYKNDITFDMNQGFNPNHFTNLNTEEGDSIANSFSIQYRDNNFHLFSFSDLFENTQFVEDLTAKDKKSNNEIIVNLDPKGKDIEHLNASKIVVVNPLYDTYGIKFKKKLVKSEKNKVALSNAFTKDYRKIDMDVSLIDSKNLLVTDVEEYNRIGILNAWRTEVLMHGEVDMLTSCNDRVAGIANDAGTDHFLFSGVFSFKNRHKWSGIHWLLLCGIYTSPLAIADVLIVHHYFQFISFSINSKTDQIEFVDISTANQRATIPIVESYVYNVLYQLAAK